MRGIIVGFRTTQKFKEELKSMGNKYGIDMSSYINMRLHEAVKRDKKQDEA